MIQRDGSEVAPTMVLKNLVATKPWLYIVMHALYSYNGLTLNELRELTDLSTSVLKRGLWWLKKYNIVKNKGDKYFLETKYIRALEKLGRNYCNLKNVHVLLLDKVYIVLYVRGGKVYYWSLPAEYNEMVLYHERLSGLTYSAEEISQMLNIDIGTAKKVKRLRELLKNCKVEYQTHGATS